MSEYKKGTWQMFSQDRYSGRSEVYVPRDTPTKYCVGFWDKTPCGLTVKLNRKPGENPELCWAHNELV